MHGYRQFAVVHDIILLLYPGLWVVVESPVENGTAVPWMQLSGGSSLLHAGRGGATVPARQQCHAAGAMLRLEHRAVPARARAGQLPQPTEALPTQTCCMLMLLLLLLLLQGPQLCGGLGRESPHARPPQGRILPQPPRPLHLGQLQHAGAQPAGAAPAHGLRL